MLTISFRSVVSSTLLLVALAGCTTEVSPYRASTGDFLFGHGRLQDYLAQRRILLAGIQGRVEVLNDQLALQLGKLESERKELAKAQQVESLSAQQRNALESKLQNEQQRADAVFSRLLNAEDELSRLRAAASEAQRQQDADQRKIRLIDGDIKRLETETEILEGTVNESVRLRVEQSLRR